MRDLYTNIFILFIAIFFPACDNDIRIVNLSCDYAENPQVVDNNNPLLNWQLQSGERGKSQSAYRIIVSGDLSLLKEDRGDLWDTGKTVSSESVIEYQGKQLDSGDQVYWKVIVWDENDKPSNWSETATWTMGLLKPSDWQAKWIGQREDQYPDSAVVFPAPYFRKEFNVAKKVKKATAYICGLGFYEMYINGNKSGDQVLAPAVTNYDRRPLKNLLYHYDDQSTQRVFYNTFDITKMLGPNNNAVGVILGNGWYNQRDRTIEGNMWYDVPKMILQIEIEYNDGTKETVLSDNSWKTTTGPLLHDAIFTGEVYDARLDLGEWNTSGYNDGEWAKALEVRPPAGSLRAQTAPFNKVMATVNATFIKNSDSLYTFTLPETVSGWCSLNVKGNRGDTVKLRFISEEGLDYGQIDTYILKGGGTETYEPRFTWHTFRKIEVITRGVPITENSITAKSIYTDADIAGTFECSNELFNRIHKAWVRTMHANFKGIVSSDPHRERLAYTGDAQVIAGSLLYTFDMKRFFRKMFDDMEDARNKNTGYVPHTAPFGGGGGGPAWGSAFVIMPGADYLHYGDTSVLEEHYEGMKQWVEYLGTRTDDRGLVVREEPDGWCLGEWSTLYNRVEIPAELVNTAYYYHVTHLMAKVAKVLNKKEEKELLDLAATIKDNFNKAFYNPQTNHYWEGRQGADAIPLALGLVPEENREKVSTALLAHLKSTDYHFDTGIMGTPLTLKVLTEDGRADIAYKLMNQMDFPGYGYLMNDKNSTLWEVWNGGGDDPNGSGHCHPMFGSVVAWFYNSLSGIKPDESSPGMKHFYIEPEFVPELTFCKASYNTLYGKISSGWETDKNGNFSLNIEVPANTTATVIFPGWDNASITESGNPITEVKNISIEKGDPVRIKVLSGSYNFMLRK
ncbi:MAG: glycoside hydrolase family 78 protein [Prevotella sp.]|nr:glycoside hydrolase family 78 protein [Prevotella sp.]